MSDDYQRIEIITRTGRCCRRSVDEKLRIVEETLALGESVSAVLNLPPALDQMGW